MKITHNFNPYPLQRTILNKLDDSAIKIVTVCTGRQVGKSLMSQYIGVKWLLTSSNCEIGFITPVYSQGKRVFNAIVKMLKRAKVMVEVNKSELTIVFENGTSYTTLKFFSADGYDSIRGNTFDYLIVDEAAFVKDEAWYEAIRPTTMVKCKKVLLLSTPKGRNWFKAMYLKGLEKGSSFTFPSHANPYIKQSELDEFKATLPPNAYKQEILGQFLDGGSEVFEDLSIFEIPVPHKIDYSKRHYAGIDVAQSNDYTVVTIMDSDGRIVEIDRFNGIKYSEMSKRIDKVLSKYKALKGVIEVNSIGQPLWEAIDSIRNKPYRLERFVTTNDSKSIIVSALIKSIQDDDLRVSTEVTTLPILLAEMGDFGFEYSPSTKKIKYGASSSSSHDDTVMSLALSNKCRLDNKSNGGIRVMGGGQRVF